MKKKLMRFLALASCVTLLTGCDSNALGGLGGKWNSFVDWGKGLLGLKKEEQKEDEKPEKEEEEEAPEEGPKKPDVKIEFFDLPEEVLPGSVIDLDDYVTISGTSETFTLSLDDGASEIATLEGHQITCSGEGDVSFTLTFGGKDYKFEVTSISNERKEFRDFFAGIEHDFVLYHLNGEKIAEVQPGGVMTHGQKYTFDQQFSEDEQSYIPGGYVEAGDGRVYTYNLEVVGEGQEAHYEPHFMLFGDEPASISDVTGGFALDYRDLEVLDADELIWDNDDHGFFFAPDASGQSMKAIKSMLQISADFANYNCTYYGTQVERFDLSYSDGQQTIEIPAYAIAPLVIHNNSLTLWDAYVIMQESDNKVEWLEQYVASKEVPQGLSFDDYADAISKFASQDTFSISTDYGLYLDGQRLTLEEISQISSSLASHWVAEARGTYNVFVSPEQIHVEEVGFEHHSFGWVKSDVNDKVYSYAYEFDEVEEGQEQTGKFVATETATPDFDDLLLYENFCFVDPEYVFEDPVTEEEFTLYDDIFVNYSTRTDIDENSYVMSAEFAGQGLLQYMYYLYVLGAPKFDKEERAGLADLIYTFLSNGYLDDLSMSVDVYYENDEVVSVELSGMMGFTSVTISGESKTIYWGFVTSFGNESAPAFEISGLPEADPQP